jgi:hypothetical protein
LWDLDGVGVEMSGVASSGSDWASFFDLIALMWFNLCECAPMSRCLWEFNIMGLWDGWMGVFPGSDFGGVGREMSGFAAAC